MPIRLGIIGLSASQSAWATSAHAVPLKTPNLSKKYQIVALCTSSPASAKAAAEFHGIPLSKAYSSPGDLANDADVDMVVVSVKVPMHKQLTIPALNTRRDVFVEWPLGKNLAEAEEMAALAKEMGVRTAVGLQARQAPSVQKAKEIIASGALGRITSTSLVVYDSAFNTLPEKAMIFTDLSNGADMLTIPCAHILDTLTYLLGEFSSLSATMSTHFPTTNFINDAGETTRVVPRTWADSITVMGGLEGGATATFAFNSCTPSTPTSLTWLISGDRGSLKFEGRAASIQVLPPKLYRYQPDDASASARWDMQGQEAGKWEELRVEEGIVGYGGVGALYAAVAREWEGGKDNGGVVDFEGAVTRHRMIDAIKRSAATGKRETYM